ncbi:macrophage migration inhibitory factor family [Prochlorococcus marinus str. MIT 9321]|uniref:L-dopachrome isomerase n=1 Tax=Prochlorococcus marinus str. MIT 9401 TaxID=167551 RepID=A0A0A2BCY2_PROMR|nr:phenylpyruvate tautomerase MIF-related protein [Prochlorococcus marinus]KGG02921.1 macrophage migration inhibitory factor family [Prochlorococcus marinus str. MIT 9321]KGG05546.1 macrophage migration inhibitory factor family [Prochlorococcus marinus str. MIT 9322]KGG10580.1 macrophage migration inhibitory factor family [Prochlorococcus marinus str. MIT 9401]
MPYINISTSVILEDKKKLLEEISILISSLTNKSKRFVMAKLEDNCEMYFDDERPCCFLELSSIGSLNPSEMSRPLSNFVNEKMGIPLDKIYISFNDVSASMWAWNGRTFG